ncbi:hypothetical protein ACFYSF_46155 [Streptomyces canus]|uniref:hypothetical protein n=1 Tax=Streptomyces canus TaxID=58343 RepID=UPI002256F6D0|nr:hypothetical protein [Streptomyces canus]MCX5255154.1 hypothetical protein [Streptomyces canus]WSW41323.1 hypothetical protein OG426_54465 [Streptomyces canus]
MAQKNSPKVSADVELDDAGRIVLNAPELSAKLRASSAAELPEASGLIININCVAGCGSGGGPIM